MTIFLPTEKRHARTFSRSFRKSVATMSGAGEKVRMLWTTLVVSILKVGFDESNSRRSPKYIPDSIAVEHRAMCGRHSRQKS